MSTKREWSTDTNVEIIYTLDNLFPKINVSPIISSNGELAWKCCVKDYERDTVEVIKQKMSLSQLQNVLEKEYPVVNEKGQKIKVLKSRLEWLNKGVLDLEYQIMADKHQIKNIQNEILELEKT